MSYAYLSDQPAEKHRAPVRRHAADLDGRRATLKRCKRLGAPAAPPHIARASAAPAPAHAAVVTLASAKKAFFDLVQEDSPTIEARLSALKSLLSFGDPSVLDDVFIALAEHDDGHAQAGAIVLRYFRFEHAKVYIAGNCEFDDACKLMRIRACVQTVEDSDLPHLLDCLEKCVDFLEAMPDDRDPFKKLTTTLLTKYDHINIDRTVDIINAFETECDKLAAMSLGVESGDSDSDTADTEVGTF